MKTKVLPYINRRDAKRFRARVDKNGPVPEHRPDLGPCWIWLLKRGDRCVNYGTFRYKGETFPAHRVAFTIAKGRLARGLVPDHLCWNPPCVNPGHLEAVDTSTNVVRGVRAREERLALYWRNAGTGLGTARVACL